MKVVARHVHVRKGSLLWTKVQTACMYAEDLCHNLQKLTMVCVNSLFEWCSYCTVIHHTLTLKKL